MPNKSFTLLLTVISLLSLALIVISGARVFAGKLAFAEYLWWINLCTLVWFLTSPWWMIAKKKRSQRSA